MKNVTVSLDERLLDQSRERANALGQSLNEYVRGLLGREVTSDPHIALKEAWARADAEGVRLNGPIPSREERNAR